MEKPLAVNLFNTLSRTIEPLVPIKPGQIGIYCCGPTVYDYQHIGNLKTFLFEDVLVRALRFSGYAVKHVMNITDVGHLVSDADEGEDKMAVAMRREKKKSLEIAEFYTNKLFDDCLKLNIARPDVVCKATEHIADMLELIKRIERNGYTYTSNGNVYFDVAKFHSYGKLAKLDLEQLKAGARIEPDPSKRSPFDFVLWFTKSKFENQELQWDSPWGRGYPGWHIECSAMSIKYLGDEFDIHCGGVDHISVHHTNEIAQSEAATGKPWVRVWMHSAFMDINAEKMSKSKGNFLILDDVTARGFDPLVFRFLCLNSHYRAHLNFNWNVVDNAKSAFEKLRGAVLALKTSAAGSSRLDAESAKLRRHLTSFSEALCDDLNMPKALAALSAVLSDKELTGPDKLALVYKFDQVLGFGFEALTEQAVESPAEVQELLTARERARAEKNWSEADRLRDAIRSKGYVIKDSAQGPTLKKL